ncbi:Isoflavone reductase [Paenibacillus pasadenensis]|uniref:Isoflavone reductase n=1 Tax=Paenibacillus pasadenensis TaxID=217090 RepID=A0A2N5NAX0_9BACL|nr:NAD-dependent epimerase/dehydratase family protein [Paenibacillus pasadenensis]PLT47496.1 Isoflavone reductase [Paenibacillus pasadenensis]
MRILVLGGTRFMGKHLVDELLREGHEVTVGSTGKTDVTYEGEPERLVLDRGEESSLLPAVQGREWDVVYDMIGYSPDEARLACRAFAGRTGRFVFVSSLAVYEPAERAQREEDWLPEGYPVTGTDRHSLSYAEGKRQSEAVLAAQADMESLFVRPPFVVGEDDYTRRLHWHVERVASGLEIGMPSPDARVQFIRSDEAGRLLSWLKSAPLSGPVNACSGGSIPLRELAGMIGSATGRRPRLTTEVTEQNGSPYGVEGSWYMDGGKAAKAGFRFERQEDWLPGLIGRLAEERLERAGRGDSGLS